jgi:hypothetical protein
MKERRPFTLILPYYENPGMLAQTYVFYRGLPDRVRALMHMIVVDDGSPKAPAFAPGDVKTPSEAVAELGVASFQLFRIDVDVRWNWLAARNIGVEHAPCDWILMTDVDHIVPEKTAAFIQNGDLDENRVYRFSRVDAPALTPYKPHPNSWLLTKRRMGKIGGYDERFSGFYGTDGEFRDRVRLHSKEIVMLDEVLVRYPREIVPDASTTQYGRKEKQDHDGVTRIRARIAREGGKPASLSFPYHRVV